MYDVGPLRGGKCFITLFYELLSADDGRQYFINLLADEIVCDINCNSLKYLLKCGKICQLCFHLITKIQGCFHVSGVYFSQQNCFCDLILSVNCLKDELETIRYRHSDMYITIWQGGSCKNMTDGQTETR